MGWGTVDQHFSVTSTATGIPLFNGSNRRSSGADAGAGFEWMIYSGWSLWVEWDHIFLESKNLSFAPIGAGVAFTENVRRDFDKVLVGLNWRFGGGSGPVRASY